jgi:hypothetical protein
MKHIIVASTDVFDTLLQREVEKSASHNGLLFVLFTAAADGANSLLVPCAV